MGLLLTDFRDMRSWSFVQNNGISCWLCIIILISQPPER